ncbi:MAG: hypothetical protein HYU66_02560 [Armatimonadetes bacterium]|nr:hypothetical protein [Armatimonadota bacterium]
MKTCATPAILLLAAAALAVEPAPIQLGQAVYRPRCTITRQKLPDGTQRSVQLELYDLTLAKEEPVWVEMRSENPLGCVVYRFVEGSEPRPITAVGMRKPFHGTLAAGRYALAVAADPPADGAYLLSVAHPPQPDGKLEPALPASPADAAAAFRGSFRLGLKPRGLSLGGGFAAVHDGLTAWLCDLEQGVRYRLPAEPGPIRRVAVSPDGWSVMVVSTSGARLLALPDLAPLATFNTEAGIRDAVYAGPRQRLAVLPAKGMVYITSPVKGDLAYLPESEGDALAVDTAGTRLAVRQGEAEVRVFDLGARQLMAQCRWPWSPSALAVHPLMPLVVGAGPAKAGLWSGTDDPTVADLPAAVDAAYGGNGLLAAVDGQGARVVVAEQVTVLEPAFAGSLVAVDPMGTRVAAVTAAGELALWDVSRLAAPQADPVQTAEAAYKQGILSLRNEDYAAAKGLFAQAVEALRQAPPSDDADKYLCLSLLRLSETTGVLKDYAASLEHADAMLAAAAALPDGELKRFCDPLARFRRGEALAGLGRQADAKLAWQDALEHGLSGPPAEDARRQLQAP